MKRFISVLLCAVFAVLAAVPSFAKFVPTYTEDGHPLGFIIDDEDAEGPKMELSDIIENYKPHTEEELASFKAELIDAELYNYFMYPDLNAEIYAVSNQQLRRPARAYHDVFGSEASIMGILKGNKYASLDYPMEIGDAEIFLQEAGDAFYGSNDGNHYQIILGTDGVAFLQSLSMTSRENFLLNFYLSVLDTDEAIGLAAIPVYRSASSGNGNHSFGYITEEEKEKKPQLSDIIENYKSHTEEELASFKKELAERGLLYYFLYPVSANMYVVSNHDIRYPDRGENGNKNNEPVVMGIIKDNELVCLNDAEELTGKTFDSVEYANSVFGSNDGIHYELTFSSKVKSYLSTLPEDDRCNFLLNLYLSVLDTDEAIGLLCSPLLLLDTSVAGDINGDGKVNAADSRALTEYLMGISSGVVPSFCDINEDGVINFRDKFALKKIMLGA